MIDDDKNEYKKLWCGSNGYWYSKDSVTNRKRSTVPLAEYASTLAL
jgi:hypothetical protein